MVICTGELSSISSVAHLAVPHCREVDTTADPNVVLLLRGKFGSKEFKFKGITYVATEFYSLNVSILTYVMVVCKDTGLFDTWFQGFI